MCLRVLEVSDKIEVGQELVEPKVQLGGRSHNTRRVSGGGRWYSSRTGVVAWISGDKNIYHADSYVCMYI